MEVSTLWISFYLIILRYALRKGAGAFAIDVKDTDSNVNSQSHQSAFKISHSPMQRRSEAGMLKEGSTGSSFCLTTILEWFTYMSFLLYFRVKFELPKRGKNTGKWEIFEGLRLLTVMTSTIKNIWSILDHFDNIVQSYRQIIGGLQYFNINSNFHFIHDFFRKPYLFVLWLKCSVAST